MVATHRTLQIPPFSFFSTLARDGYLPSGGYVPPAIRSSPSNSFKSSPKCRPNFNLNDCTVINHDYLRLKLPSWPLLARAPCNSIKGRSKSSHVILFLFNSPQVYGRTRKDPWCLQWNTVFTPWYKMTVTKASTSHSLNAAWDWSDVALQSYS